MRRKLILPGVVLLLACAIGVYFAFFRPSPDSVDFQTAEVKRGEIAAKVTATGTLSALVTVQVGSQVSGRIQEIMVDFNSEVRKGDLLARIDPQLFVAAERQAAANLQSAQGNLQKAEAQADVAARQLDRQRELFAQKLISQAELDTMEADAQVARASVTTARAAVAQNRAAHDQSKVNLEFTRILSPIDGIVISRAVDVGQTVAAAFQAPTLFTIAEDLTRMQVNTSVAEADIGKLQAGMEARFTVDAYPQKTFTGIVRQIRNAPTTVQNVVTYDAVIDVKNPELKLKPGMTANVTLIHAQADNVLRIPNAALRFRLPSDRVEAREARGAARPGVSAKRTVYLLKNEEPRQVEITTGLNDGSFTELVEGEIKENDLLIIGGGAREAPASGGTALPTGGGQRRIF